MRTQRFVLRQLSTLGFILLVLALAACVPSGSEVGLFAVEAEVVPEQTTTYEDKDVGFALDYPASWYVLKTQPEDKQNRGYLASFSSWPLTPESGEILEGETRFDVTVLRWEPLDLVQFVAPRRSAWEAGGLTISSEESWVLAKDLPASRFLVSTPDEGTVFFLLTLIGDRFVSLSGTGDLELLEQIARTLRPTDADEVSVPGCPEAAPGTHQLVAAAQGICFLYPDTYNAFQGEDGTITLYVRALVGSHVPLASISYSAAEGQSLEEITAQRVLDYAWTETKPESITLGGEAAVMLDNLPGQDTNRRVVAVHDGRVYDLMISGIGANYGAAGELAEALYDTVIASFQFIGIEPDAPLLAGPECPEVKANSMLYTNEALGYCLLLPAAYSALQLDPEGTEMAFYVDSIQDTAHARLFIKVTDADGRTLEEVTMEREAEIEKAVPGSDVMWSFGSMLDGEPANEFHQVPGQELSRQVVTLHNGRLYTLTFVPDDPAAGDAYAEMESLYEMVMDSFSFLWQSEEVLGT